MRSSACRSCMASLFFIWLFILLAGCRPSPALERLVYTQDADELADSDIRLISYQYDSQEEADNISPQQENLDSSDKRDVLENLPVWDRAGLVLRAASRVMFDLNAVSDFDTEHAVRIEQTPQ